MYDTAAQAIVAQLVKQSTPSGLIYLAEKEGEADVDKMDHLACFASGMFALGAYLLTCRSFSFFFILFVLSLLQI